MIGQFTQRRRTSEAYKRFGETEDGRIILADILRFCGHNHSVLGANPDESHARAAMYSVAQRIKSFTAMSEQDFKSVLDDDQVAQERMEMGDFLEAV